MLRTVDGASDLKDSVEKGVFARTYGRVRDFRVEMAADGVILRGRCASYYLKQLAQSAAMDALDGESVVNAIEVG